jgi:hypothetical protein
VSDQVRTQLGARVNIALNLTKCKSNATAGAKNP